MYNQTQDRLLQQRKPMGPPGHSADLRPTTRAARRRCGPLAFATDGDGARPNEIIDRYVGAAPKPFASPASTA